MQRITCDSEISFIVTEKELKAIKANMIDKCILEIYDMSMFGWIEMRTDIVVDALDKLKEGDENE